MSFLTLNGVEFPVASYEVDEIVVGDSGRALDGSPLETVRTRKTVIRGTTPPMTKAEADAWRGLLRGLGERVSFESDTYTDKGLAPSSSVGSPTIGGAGAGSVTLEGYFGGLEWTLPQSPKWTIICAAYRPSPAWRHFVLRSDGAGWTNAVVDPDASAWPSPLRIAGYNSNNGILRIETPAYNGANWAASTAVSGTYRDPGNATIDFGVFATFQAMTGGTTGATPPTWPGGYGDQVVDGTVTWQNVGVAFGAFRDLVWLPYEVPDSWVPGLYSLFTASSSESVWSETSPFLTVGGDLFEGEASGVVGTSRGVSFADSDGWQATGVSFDFEIRER